LEEPFDLILNYINFKLLFNFIFNYYLCSQSKSKIESIKKNSYDGCITFEYVYSKSQIIVPLLYHDLMCEEKASDNAIQIFINFILVNHREDKILDLILPML
jgi:hypothetical protein